MWNTVKLSLASIFVALVVAFASVTGYAIRGDNGGTGGSVNNGSDSAEFGLLDEIADILREDFVNPGAVTDETLEIGSINGIIESLGDPHTVYITPEQYQNGFDIISGTFEGIGATVDQDPTTGLITIVTPFRDSPAEQAGILPGDAILAVDGETTDGWTVQEAVNRIRGPQGSEIRLTIRHPGETESQEVTITRGTIVVPTVFVEDVTDADGNVVPDLAYVEIQQFTDQTVGDLRDELNRINDGGYRGIILDLRRNPGGGLDATVSVADMFLDGGTVLTQVDREGNETVYEASSGGEGADLAVAILVSAGSASGSEVLAGALRDHGRATLIGEQTFGKGSVNHLRELSNGGALYVTIARWLTPNGDLIEGVGLTPDQVIDTSGGDDILGNAPLYAAIDVLEAQLAASAASQ
ncbi:MAG TPA: S41 family peptidase [Dehalococcoidia bacterium]|nr:S41 family peptidase [Dehalococcoidia bacterium]